MASVPGGEIPLSQSALGKLGWQLEKTGAPPDGQLKGNTEQARIKPYPLHRLDYETSGVLLFGKFPRDREALEGIFQHPSTRKKYVALVKGAPQGSEINIPLPARESGEKIPAKTTFRITKIFRGKPFPLALVEAEIETGRKHQIRQHFAKIGHPVLLDQKYGDARLNRMFRLNFRLGRLFLHAASLQFHHPLLKKTVLIEAPMAPDLKVVLKRLG